MYLHLFCAYDYIFLKLRFSCYCQYANNMKIPAEFLHQKCFLKTGHPAQITEMSKVKIYPKPD